MKTKMIYKIIQSKKCGDMCNEGFKCTRDIIVLVTREH